MKKSSSAASTKRSSKKRYVLVGVGGRSHMFAKAVLSTYKATSTLLALCDTNRTRMEYANETYRKEFGLKKDLPMFHATEFEAMIRKHRPDAVIVCSMDRTHHHYIIKAMEMGCDAITEKPMTTDAEKCQQILDAVERTGRKLRVTFNYRYSPVRTKVCELLREGTIGEVKAVHFEWLLDTTHGADYFRRWHRDKRNSGGLMVHKATHHFDLVNWWLDSTPELVFGLGSLLFYGKANAEQRGEFAGYSRATGAANAKNDPFALNLNSNDALRRQYLEAEHEDGYLRDQSVFGDGISIEDTMNVLVRYGNGAQMSYSLCAFQPWEGYRVSFTGTKGRIELHEVESSYVSGRDKEGGITVATSERILVHPHWKPGYSVEPPPAEGGHGGGDAPMLRDIFAPSTKKDPLERAASHVDGAWSILTGIAANQSFATGLPVKTRELVRLPDSK